jgi:hypothetical protein
MATIEDYVHYDVKLPNKSLLITAITAGWAILATSLAALIWTAVLFLTDRDLSRRAARIRPSYCDEYGLDPNVYTTCKPIPSLSVFSAEWLFGHWYVGLIGAVIGIVIASYFHSSFRRYFRKVRQGKILKRDTTSGGDYALEWQVLVEGNTYANERRQSWNVVNAGYWQDAQVGDWFDERN